MLRVPQLSVRVRVLLGIVLAVGAGVVVLATPLDAPPAVAVVVLGLGALVCWDSRDRLAWAFGALLPVDIVTNVPGAVFDVARYAAVAWLVLRFEADLSPERRRPLRILAALMGALALVRGAFSLARQDEAAMLVAFIMAVGTASAVLLGRRVRAHPHIVSGFLAGMAFSSTIALMQALEIPTLRPGNQQGVRFPGLASSTALLTWQLSYALIIGVWLLVTRAPRLRDRITAWVALPLCGMALVVCGAQGGLLGLAVAAFAVAVRSRRVISWGKAARYALAGLGAVAALGLLVVVLGVRTPTIGGLSDHDYTNEDARLQVAEDGLRELGNHPLTGMGETRFYDQYGLSPHFLPIDSGVTAGVLGFAISAALLGWVVSVAVRGPVGRAPQAWLGYALLAAVSANALVEAAVVVAGLSRVTLLTIAVLACRGEPWPGEPARSGRARGLDPQVQPQPV